VGVDFDDITSTGETTTFLNYATPDIALRPDWLASACRITYRTMPS